jgi:hypothetical protein
MLADKARRPAPEKALGVLSGAILGGLCGVGHPGFVAFAAVANRRSAKKKRSHDT